MNLSTTPSRHRQSIFRRVASLLVVTSIATSNAAWAGDQIEHGRKLFEHHWTARDPLSRAGDGPGPMHNADSCVACHILGGIGGAGSNGHNVSLLTVRPQSDNPAATAGAAQLQAGKIHPGFVADSGRAATLLLHHLSTDDDYAAWRLSVLGFKPQADMQSKKAAKAVRTFQEKLSSLPPVAEVRTTRSGSLLLSQRNTTALWGTGLIDSVSEKTLEDLARQQSQGHPEIHGRLCRTASGHVGRFGWRGQVATLRDFVLTACAMELGLQNAGHPQPRNPLHPKDRMEGNDLTPEQCDALIAFVAALPAPRQVLPTDLEHANLVRNGEKVFETIGCAGCHVRDIDKAVGIYSDLLLHDMGPGLEDPLPAFPEQKKVGTMSGGNTGYGGSLSIDVMATVASPIRREWKTAPLWGVRDSAPYLHDGRARTLAEAIAAHGGEAAPSAKRFAELDELTHANVLLFLHSLAASEASR